jgi:uncharacterized protein (TIGR02996 family)
MSHLRLHVQLGELRWVEDLPATGRVTLGRARAHSWSRTQRHLELRDSSVSLEHAWLTLAPGACFIHDQQSVNRTVVNGRVVREAELVPGDLVTLGLAVLRLEDVPDPSEEEAGLLAGLRSGATAGREVFADWLEAHGRLDEAAWLRAEVQSQTTRDDAFRDHWERLARRVGLNFRATIARARIDGCDAEGCLKRWERLEPRFEACLRRCAVCSRDVVYCGSVAEARSVSVGARVARAPVVVDPSVHREPDDLGRPFTVIG